MTGDASILLLPPTLDPEVPHLQLDDVDEDAMLAKNIADMGDKMWHWGGKAKVRPTTHFRQHPPTDMR